MFLRSKRRFKNGKWHRYYSVVENRRLPGNRVVQRHLLYLGEINDSQEAAWRKTLAVLRGLHLDRFWAACFADQEGDVAWEQVLAILAINRLVAPGSEWRVHRE